MSANELRKLLFEINDQDLTVRELRQILFDLEDQVRELTTEDFQNMP